ncbi:hypothetical protein D7Y13_44945, partial [Corallococcus praedator]
MEDDADMSVVLQPKTSDDDQEARARRLIDGVSEGGAAGDEGAVLIRESADMIAEEGHIFGKRDVVVTQKKVSVYDGAGVE